MLPFQGKLRLIVVEAVDLDLLEADFLVAFRAIPAEFSFMDVLVTGYALVDIALDPFLGGELPGHALLMAFRALQSHVLAPQGRTRILVMVESFRGLPLFGVVAIQAFFLLEHLAVDILMAGQALGAQPEKGAFLEFASAFQDESVPDELGLMAIGAFGLEMGAFQFVAGLPMVEVLHGPSHGLPGHEVEFPAEVVGMAFAALVEVLPPMQSGTVLHPDIDGLMAVAAKHRIGGASHLVAMALGAIIQSL